MESAATTPPSYVYDLLTNWCHQHSPVVDPNNTCVCASISTGEVTSVNAKMYSRPWLFSGYLVVNQFTSISSRKNTAIQTPPEPRFKSFHGGTGTGQSVSYSGIATCSHLLCCEASEDNTIELGVSAISAKVEFQRTLLVCLCSNQNS